MKWSKKTGLALGLTIVALNLNACKFNSSSKSSKVSKAAVGGQPATPTTEATPASNEDNDFAKACYQELCLSDKNEISQKDFIEKSKNPSEADKKYYDEHISSLVTQMTTSQAEAKNSFLEILNKHNEDFEKTELTPEQERLVKAFYMLLNMKTLPESVQKSLSEAMASLDFSKAQALASTKDVTAYLTSLYPNTSLLQAAKNEAKFLLQKQEDINTKATARILNLEQGAIGRIKSELDINPDDLTPLVNNSYAIRSLVWLSQADNAIVNNFDLSTEKIKEIYKTSNLKEKIKNRVKSLDSVAKSCETRFYQTLSLSPGVSEIENFKAISEDVRTQVLGRLNPEDSAFQIVDKAKIYFPTERNEAVKKWITVLNDRISLERQETNRIKGLDASSALVLGTLLSMSYSENENPCENIIKLNITEDSKTIDDGVQVSLFSIKKPSYGISLLAHDFAHLVSKHSTHMTSQKTCLKDKQDSEQFVEEDFADQMAAQVSAFLQNKIQLEQTNYGCLLASAEDNLSLISKDAKAKKSPALYRALQIAQGRQQAIPDICKVLVKIEAPKALDSCE